MAANLNLAPIVEYVGWGSSATARIVSLHSVVEVVLRTPRLAVRQVGLG
jgi:hypothetical protein